MYLAADGEGFFLRCARDIAQEFQSGRQLKEISPNGSQHQEMDIYEALVKVSQGVNWQQKQPTNIANEFKSLLN